MKDTEYTAAAMLWPKWMVQSLWKIPRVAGSPAPWGSSQQPPPGEPAELCSLSAVGKGTGTCQGLKASRCPRTVGQVSPVEEARAGYR